MIRSLRTGLVRFLDWTLRPLHGRSLTIPGIVDSFVAFDPNASRDRFDCWSNRTPTGRGWCWEANVGYARVLIDVGRTSPTPERVFRWFRSV
jgi:hypothetical protein